MDINSETINANVIKNIVLGQLAADKIITNDEANIYGQNWQILIVKKTWFTKMISKAKSSTEDWFYKYVPLSFDGGYQPKSDIKL